MRVSNIWFIYENGAISIDFLSQWTIFKNYKIG